MLAGVANLSAPRQRHQSGYPSTNFDVQRLQLWQATATTKSAIIIKFNVNPLAESAE